MLLLAVIVLSVGLAVGLNTGAGSAGHSGSTTATISVTVPEPAVTTVTRPTPPAADLPGTGKPIVHLGDGNTPDEFIIGQLYQVALEHEGYTVVLNRNASVPTQQVAGLQNGRLDLYPEFLGAWNSWIAHLHRRFRTLRDSVHAMAATYARRHWLRAAAKADAIQRHRGTRRGSARPVAEHDNHVYSIPQLARGAPIVFGAPSTFQRIADGLPALERGYGLHPYYLQTILYTLQYWWSACNTRHWATAICRRSSCNTTDPLLAGPKFVELQDPKHVFGYGNVVPVTTPAVLKAEGKMFKHTIELVDSLLTLRAMRGLDAESELGGHLPPEVAAAKVEQEFLEGNGILPRSRYAPVQTTTTATPSA